MKATPDDQLRLLDLQSLDSALDRLAHRRRTLPEIEAADQLAARIVQLADDMVLVETEDSDLAREQSKLEGDIDVVRTRMGKDQERLDAGQVSSPRELENLQSEIESLKRRQSDLEDEELEIMERREAVQSRLDEMKTERDEQSRMLGETEQRRDATFVEIDAEVDKTSRQRSELGGAIPAELLALYEKVRGASGGVGAAALHRGRCEGCHLQLNTTDLNRLREAPPDDVVRCEECRRILVRTEESGL
ncbi:MAG TPA: C4-type zinc ribbon domain-containing protein [Mycobacteriales bacterium]|nr:C4-type zinc ribbon domain-containing protein [Mycobacteriales bacterium]